MARPRRRIKPPYALLTRPPPRQGYPRSRSSPGGAASVQARNAVSACSLIAISIVGRMFRGVARPVGDLIEAAGRIEAGGYDARVPERGPREMRSLAHAFNAMTARLVAP